MRLKLAKTFIILVVSVVLLNSCPQVFSANYNATYELLNHFGGTVHYKLNVVVSESLYEYYTQKSHRLISDSDFAKFVTPFALKPIDDSLREIYADDEGFANGALMIVHQISYEETEPSKYPVETIVENVGDCDLFSFIAASIMTAGGLDIVFFYYEAEAHMNIGVSLQHDPHDARGEVDYVENAGVRFYVAECTGGNWQNGWRVGECPDNLKGASLRVISVEDPEESAPGQVSASCDILETSRMSLDVSFPYLVQGTSVTISGQLSPALQNKTVTIYVKVNSSPWTVLGTIATDARGGFKHVWSPSLSGICNIRASWSGDNDYAPADSPTLTLTVLSLFFVLLVCITVVLTIAGVVVFLISRSYQEMPEHQSPETLS